MAPNSTRDSRPAIVHQVGERLVAGKIGNPASLNTLAGLQGTAPRVAQPSIAGKDETEVRQAFDRFVGETFFGQMINVSVK